MSKASELMERVLKQMERRDVRAYWVNGIHQKDEPYTFIDGKVVTIEQTFRQNGIDHGLENVTVTIRVLRAETSTVKEFQSYCGVLHTLEKVKVPKDASDNVINKRIDKIEAALNF